MSTRRILATVLTLSVAAGTMSAHTFYCVEPGGADGKGIQCDITVEKVENREIVHVVMRNLRHTPFQPVKAGIRLGVDTYMDRYPEWNNKYFPTMMICEPTHCYGYMQSPSGKVKAIVSDSPVASWSLDYNLGYMEPEPYWFYGHRIKSLNLDLLSTQPQPDRHPRGCRELGAGEAREWTLQLIDIDGPDDFEKTVHYAAGLPVPMMSRTSCRPGESIEITIYGHNPKVKDGSRELPVRAMGNDTWSFVFRQDNPGIYELEINDGDKQTHGYVNVTRPWNEIIRKARREALRCRQKASSHVESWYGFHTAFLAARYFPDHEPDSALNARFDMVAAAVFNPESGRQNRYEWRIQNAFSTVGMLADRYEAYGNKEDLLTAERIADRVISDSQRADGAFMNGQTDYSAVIYPAKSLLELADAEYAASRRSRGRKYEKAAQKAIDRLVTLDGNFNTEGEITYEDGMVSCAALQMGAMALRCKDADKRSRYRDAMLKLLEGHDCLTQLRVADGRRRGGTMRFWEAQYDVHVQPNMISSPHGWSAWRAYATYYAWLLTGDEKWLAQTFDAAASFAALVDFDTHRLNWAFVVDPAVNVRQISVPDSTLTADTPSYGCPHPDMYPHADYTIGERYVPMISDWQTLVSSDNDVHEVFKFIAEAVLTNAFVVERRDGSLGCYNCSASLEDGVLTVIADEPQMTNLYISSDSDHKVKFKGEIICIER